MKLRLMVIRPFLRNTFRESRKPHGIIWGRFTSSGAAHHKVKVGPGAVIMSLAVRRMIMMASVALLVAAMDGSRPPPEEKYHRCGEEDNPASDYQSLADWVAKNLIDNTHEQNYNLYNQKTENELTSYGHGICVTYITVEDCIRCLQAANSLRLQLCHFVMDSIISLTDCYMRISDLDFRWDPAESIF
ncbi:hypothetical protein MLD38_030060 [Melastoma candidum]|uniref:Uncharacterized protein n=1 Tax=Melastoma candidum TaxID=119954 RepID=A0ACB9ML45_9MYRT|nr:hypothetical protein MLD38_030060 [Melastoma candidum]